MHFKWQLSHWPRDPAARHRYCCVRFLYGTVTLKVAVGVGGQFVLCSACLKVLDILLRIFQFIFNIVRKKEMSPEAPIELANDFPILLGPFAKLQNKTISSVMPVPPSVCPHEKI
jgi:hypothetical protein